MKRLWIDTDTASDDAVAILMALRWPDEEIVIEGISTVSGNVTVDDCNQNALYTVELCGKHVPVYQGAGKPLLREPVFGYFFHGPDGMGGMNYPESKLQIEDNHAVNAFIDCIQANPNEIILVTLGPLTNIALALAIAPDLAEKIPMCYTMGGAAATLGNITPTAEFNIYVDPEAANMVFHSGMPLTMVGWELCRGEANLDEDEIQGMLAMDTIYSKFAVNCNRQAIQTNREWLGEPMLPLPDPITMAIALDPSICTRKSSHYVTVDVQGEATRGMTIVDERGVLEKDANITVCWAIDIPGWKEALYKTLR
jgi:inosine-uridine nucleoside N-ribohydrolase